MYKFLFAGSPWTFVLLALTVAPSIVLAGGAKDEPRDPVRLVRTMQLGRAFLLGAQGELVRSATARQRALFLACTDKADLSQVSALAARRIKLALTAGEIADSIRFYESEAGRKYTLRDMNLMVSETLKQPMPQVQFSTDELSKIADFTASAAGAKLITHGAPLINEIVNDSAAPIMSIVGACARQSR